MNPIKLDFLIFVRSDQRGQVVRILVLPARRNPFLLDFPCCFFVGLVVFMYILCCFLVYSLLAKYRSCCFLVYSLLFMLFLCIFRVVLLYIPCCFYVVPLLFSCWQNVVLLLVLPSKWHFPEMARYAFVRQTHLVRERPKTLEERQRVFRIRFANSCKQICFYARPGLDP